MESIPDVFLDQLWRDADDMLAFPILDQVEGLEGGNDVALQVKFEISVYHYDSK